MADLLFCKSFDGGRGPVLYCTSAVLYVASGKWVEITFSDLPMDRGCSDVKSHAQASHGSIGSTSRGESGLL